MDSRNISLKDLNSKSTFNQKNLFGKKSVNIPSPEPKSPRQPLKFNREFKTLNYEDRMAKYEQMLFR